MFLVQEKLSDDMAKLIAGDRREFNAFPFNAII